MATEREFEVGLSAEPPQKLPSYGKRITFIAKMIKKIPKWVQARAFDEGACLKMVISTAFARKPIYRFSGK